MIIRNIVDMFDRYFPFGAVFLDCLRRSRIDFSSLVRGFKPWHSMELECPGLTIEVTNICNSNCRFCGYRYQEKFRRDKGIMPDDIFDKAIDEYKQMGGTFIGLTPFSGEPLIDPKIIERVNRAKQIGAWTGFYTNGILLNRIDVKELLESGIDALVVSTAPFERNMYELVYQNRFYDEVLQGLSKLLMARNLMRKDLSIGIAFRSHIPMKHVLALPDFRKFILPLMTKEDFEALIVNTRGFDTWGGQITSKDMVGIMRLALPPLIKRRPCAWTFGLYLTWDGQVRACACRFAEAENRDGKDDLYLGDIMQSSLNEIWMGPEIRKLRRSFLEGNLPLVCRNCTMYRPC
jgi:MoaA/NifB/PqqE/SkfB family radical SAM enzyme